MHTFLVIRYMYCCNQGQQSPNSHEKLIPWYSNVVNTNSIARHVDVNHTNIVSYVANNELHRSDSYSYLILFLAPLETYFHSVIILHMARNILILNDRLAISSNQVAKPHMIRRF